MSDIIANSNHILLSCDLQVSFTVFSSKLTKFKRFPYPNILELCQELGWQNSLLIALRTQSFSS